MGIIKKTGALAILLVIACSCFSFAATEIKAPLFSGIISEDNVNIRTDSTTSSAIICAIKKDERVEIIAELYDWYKIRLPISAPAYIKKSFLEVLDSRSAKVLSNNVNIRLHPTTNGPIIGKARQNETVFIAEDRDEWFRIYPTLHTFGWIHKNFVKRSEPAAPVAAKKIMPPPKNEAVSGAKIILISIEGTLKPKTFTKAASHKLIDKNKKVYLVFSNDLTLSAYNNKRIRATGILVDPAKQSEPLVEIKKIEALD